MNIAICDDDRLMSGQIEKISRKSLPWRNQ